MTMERICDIIFTIHVKLAPTVVRIPLEESMYRKVLTSQGENALWAVRPDTGHRYRVQLFEYGMEASLEEVAKEPALYILMDEAYSGEVALYAAEPEEVPQGEERRSNPWLYTRGVYFKKQDENARVIVCYDGEPVTRYYYSSDMPKPYMYPLYGPGRKSVIQNEPADHIHHHGIWWGHDEVNGHQVYHEFQGEGRQRHHSFLLLRGGPVVGQMTELVDWLSETGELLMQDTRTIRFYNLPPEMRYIDFCTVLHASRGPVQFGPTKEGGFPFVRVNEQMCADLSGTLTASGGRNGEQEIFGETADWVDCSGVIGKDRTEAGLAMMIGRDSQDYPNRWFVRDYGPMTASNFHFQGGYLLEAGGTYTFRQRILVHAGDSKQADIEGRCQEYAQMGDQLWSIE